MNTLALIIAIIFFIIGIIGTIAPALPGSILIYIGMIIYGIMTKFETLTPYFYVIQGIALLLTFVVDFVATASSTKKFGGSKQAQWGAIIGTIFGTIILGPIGIVLGAFVGAMIAEILKGIDLKNAIRSGVGSIVGTIGGSVIKIIIEVVMIIYFFIEI